MILIPAEATLYLLYMATGSCCPIATPVKKLLEAVPTSDTSLLIQKAVKLPTIKKKGLKVKAILPEALVEKLMFDRTEKDDVGTGISDGIFENRCVKGSNIDNRYLDSWKLLIVLKACAIFLNLL